MFILPLPPPRANPSHTQSWGQRDRWQRRAYRESAVSRIKYQLAQQGGLPAPLERARVRPHFYLWSQMDHDGAVSRLKAPLDSLVAAGVLVNDNPTHCLLEIPQQTMQRATRRKNESKLDYLARREKVRRDHRLELVVEALG